MAINADPVAVTSFILAFTILVLGIAGCWKTRNSTVLLIGTAFGLFAFTHLITLLGLADILEWFQVIVRIVGYLIVIYAILVILSTKPAAPPGTGR